MFHVGGPFGVGWFYVHLGGNLRQTLVVFVDGFIVCEQSLCRSCLFFLFSFPQNPFTVPKFLGRAKHHSLLSNTGFIWSTEMVSINLSHSIQNARCPFRVFYSIYIRDLHLLPHFPHSCLCLLMQVLHLLAFIQIHLSLPLHCVSLCLQTNPHRSPPHTNLSPPSLCDRYFCAVPPHHLAEEAPDKGCKGPLEICMFSSGRGRWSRNLQYFTFLPSP